VFKKIPIDTARKLLKLGAIIPADAVYLSKLPYDDFVEQIELTGRKIDFELESNCIYFSTVNVLEWVRINSCEPTNVLVDLTVAAFEHGKDKFLFYINAIKDDAETLDKMIYMLTCIIQYAHMDEFPDHIVNEELSFFLLLYLIRHGHELSMDKINNFIYPNIKKYIESDISEYFGNSTNEIKNIYVEVIRKRYYKEYAKHYDATMKNTRELLDYADANFIR